MMPLVSSLPWADDLPPRYMKPGSKCGGSGSGDGVSLADSTVVVIGNSVPPPAPLVTTGTTVVPGAVCRQPALATAAAATDEHGPAVTAAATTLLCAGMQAPAAGNEDVISIAPCALTPPPPQTLTPPGTGAGAPRRTPADRPVRVPSSRNSRAMWRGRELPEEPPLPILRESLESRSVVESLHREEGPGMGLAAGMMPMEAAAAAADTTTLAELVLW